MLIYVLFYANDGNRNVYVPKSQRKWRRTWRIAWLVYLKAGSFTTPWLAFLKAWTSTIWHAIITQVFNLKSSREYRRRLKIAYKHKANARYNGRRIKRKQKRLGQQVYHDLLVQQAITAMAAYENKTERDVVFDTDSKPVGIDNRASAYISGDIDDFDGELEETNRVIKGFGGTRTTNVYRGTAVLKIEDDEGKVHKDRLPNSYYVPGTKGRLLSPQHWSRELRKQKRKGVYERTEHDRIILYWEDGSKKTVLLDPVTNVATFQTAPGYSKFVAFRAEAGFETDDETEPLTVEPAYISDDEDAETIEFDDIGIVSKDSEGASRESEGASKVSQDLEGATVTPPSHSDINDMQGPKENRHPVVIEEELERKAMREEAELLQYHYRYAHASFNKLQTMAKQRVIPRKLANCRQPVCAACMYGKATKRQWRHKSPHNKAESVEPTRPGQVVSVDQMKSPTPGFVAQGTGILTTARYWYATVYVDQYSSLGYLYLQKTSTAEETLLGKMAFEYYCAQHGVKVQHYHADNGIFRAHKWVLDCRAKGQGLTFAGVNAHHQNGRAEARIRRLQEMARTMLIHAKSKWPQEISANLWPYAMRTANEANNITPNMNDKRRRSPMELFANTRVASNPKHWQHFGCPVYVLSEELQSGKFYHKWKQRSRVGIYLGRSPHHARSVALVLNVHTGLVSPQFHVKLDTAFDTISQIYQGETKHLSLWQLKAGFLSSKTIPKGQKAKTESVPPSQPVRHQQTPFSREGGIPTVEEAPETQQKTPSQQAQRELSTPSEVPTQQPRQAQTQAQNPPRRSKRIRNPSKRLIQSMMAEIVDQEIEGELFSFQAMFSHDDTYTEADGLLAFKAKADPDTMYLHQALKEPDRDEFIKAMEKEVYQQVDKKVYSIILRSQVPKDAVVLPAVWQLRRKRDIITGAIKKYKARCNIDGSQMIPGKHYDLTYAPVAGWTAVRIILALVLLFSWHTVQLDYVLAYPQAPAERDLYMELPKGFTIQGVNNPKDYVLHIHRNIYGQKQAGRVWFQFLLKKLKSVGFEQSVHDECVFFKGRMIYVLYTDDSILAGPDPKEIKRTVKQMQAAGLDITIEGDLTDFLGVNIDRHDDGTIHLTQPHLIHQILKDLRYDNDDVAIKTTPGASSRLLSKHNKSAPFDNSFHYRSVIGKINYLERGCRPDISYMTHQCARFTSDPKVEHGKAVRWLARYLKGTVNKGLILKPDPSKSLEVFVDSDFAGNWDRELAGLDDATARSRHGYVIYFAGMPIIWKSQLQQEICLSSTEAEITGLSYALREAIPIMELLKEIQSQGHKIQSKTTEVHCKVFEDNSGAVEIAKFPKYRPRTKHLNIRLFHFRSYVDRSEITIHSIKSEDQPADVLTKPLSEKSFVKHRKKINGW